MKKLLALILAFTLCPSLYYGQGVISGNGGPPPFPQSGTSICYALPTSIGGSDLNSGLWWGTAKADIMACYDLMPSTGGEIDFTDGGAANKPIPACKATDPAGCGIWLMGFNDPNYSSPPAGWRIAKPVRFRGVGGSCYSPVGHYGKEVCVSAGGSSPAIWLSSSTTPVQFTGFALTGNVALNPIAIGEDSNGANTALSGWIGASFDTCNITNNGPYSALAGPGVLIEGGNSFNILFDHCVIQGSQNATPGSDIQAAILVKPPNTTGSGDGLITVQNSVVSGGEIKFYSGNNPSSLTVNNVYSEVIAGGSVTPCVGTVWLATGMIQAAIHGIGTADPSGNVCDVRNDTPNTLDPSWVTISGNLNTGGLYVQGPALILTDNSVLATESPFRQGQIGFQSGRVVGYVGNAQRKFGLTSARFANLVAAQASWTVTGGGTVTTGVAAPDGTAGAVTGTATAPAQGLRFMDANETWAVGDYFLATVWASYPSGYPNGPNLISWSGAGNTATCRILTSPITGDGEFEQFGKICKVTASASSPSEIIMSLPVSNTSAVTAYGPVMNRIPAGTVSDNEAYEYWNNLSSYPNDCVVGQACLMHGLQAKSDSVQTGSATAQPTCASAQRGTFWTVYSGAGVKDTVAVCTKDGSDVYAWRTIY